MRVLFLVNDLGNGGLERQLSLLATHLPRHWEPRVWTMGGGPYERVLRDAGIGVSVRRRRSRFDLSPAVELWRELRSWRPDVVHSWGWMPALAAGPMCRVLRTACVDGMIRSGGVERDHTLLKRLGMESATLVVANSGAGLRAWGVGRAKGRVVYNGFDWDRVTACAARRPCEPGTFVVVMTGRMNPVKQFGVVVDAARLLSAEEGGWRFVLVGDGPDRDDLIRRAGDLVARGVVEFAAPGLEVLGIVAGADVGVLLTEPRLHREGISNSIMEYMALGLPVVCGEGGGNPELVEDGVTGLIIPPGRPGALAGALRRLRHDRAAARDMGRAGRERIVRDFSVEAMVSATVAVYAEARALVLRAAWR